MSLRTHVIPRSHNIHSRLRQIFDKCEPSALSLTGQGTWHPVGFDCCYRLCLYSIVNTAHIAHHQYNSKPDQLLVSIHQSIEGKQWNNRNLVSYLLKREQLVESPNRALCRLPSFQCPPLQPVLFSVYTFIPPLYLFFSLKQKPESHPHHDTPVLSPPSLIPLFKSNRPTEECLGCHKGNAIGFPLL